MIYRVIYQNKLNLEMFERMEHVNKVREEGIRGMGNVYYGEYLLVLSGYHKVSVELNYFY